MAKVCFACRLFHLGDHDGHHPQSSPHESLFGRAICSKRAAVLPARRAFLTPRPVEASMTFGGTSGKRSGAVWRCANWAVIAPGTKGIVCQAALADKPRDAARSSAPC